MSFVVYYNPHIIIEVTTKRAFCGLRDTFWYGKCNSTTNTVATGTQRLNEVFFLQTLRVREEQQKNHEHLWKSGWCWYPGVLFFCTAVMSICLKTKKPLRTFLCHKTTIFQNMGTEMGSSSPPNRAESLETKIVWSVFKFSFEGVVDSWGRTIKTPKKWGPKQKSRRKSPEILETDSWNRTKKQIRRSNPPGGFY